MTSVTRKTRIIDTYIGGKIREARKETDMSCEDLGRKIKITGNMVNKYETAQNRITVARLGDICKVLMKPISYFLPHDFGSAFI